MITAGPSARGRHPCQDPYHPLPYSPGHDVRGNGRINIEPDCWVWDFRQNNAYKFIRTYYAGKVLPGHLESFTHSHLALH
jgi:hypothetical protein